MLNQDIDIVINQHLGQIGKYQILRPLGEGATSEVFLCQDAFLGRQVALKRVRSSALKDAIDGPVFARFFAAEAALVGRLQHPNIAQIYDAVADSDTPYLVMEYVPGTTLKTFCRPDKLLGLASVVEIGFKLAKALGYVYREGLIHRDIKPANILAMPDEQNGVHDVKLTDFGSVLNLSAATTQIHQVGSLAYMGPEQLDGQTLDCRADMYSLGAVLYHLIAGRPPFEAPSQAALMNQIYNVTPVSLCGLRTGVSEALDAVVQKALAKSREGRFADWDAFAQALSDLMTTHQVPRGQLQGVLDSERFNLLRSLDFFNAFGDVQLWEVVHRAQWQRLNFGHAIYKRGEEGGTFHIIAQGAVAVHREGQRVALLGAGTSVGEMAYLAPNPELKRHSTDVIAAEPTTTVSFTPESLAQLQPECQHLFDRAFIKVLVRRLHAAHEAMAHPRRIL